MIIFAQHAKTFDVQPTNSLCHKKLSGRMIFRPAVIMFKKSVEKVIILWYNVFVIVVLVRLCHCYLLICPYIIIEKE